MFFSCSQGTFTLFVVFFYMANVLNLFYVEGDLVYGFTVLIIGWTCFVSVTLHSNVSPDVSSHLSYFPPSVFPPLALYLRSLAVAVLQ